MKCFNHKLLIFAKKKKRDRIFSHQIGCHDCQEGNPFKLKKMDKLQNTQRLCFKQIHGEKTPIYMQNSIIPKELGHLFKHAA